MGGWAGFSGREFSSYRPVPKSFLAGDWLLGLHWQRLLTRLSLLAKSQAQGLTKIDCSSWSGDRSARSHGMHKLKGEVNWPCSKRMASAQLMRRRLAGEWRRWLDGTNGFEQRRHVTTLMVLGLLWMMCRGIKLGFSEVVA